MISKYSVAVLTALCLLLSFTSGQAQAINSVYSMYGLGLMTDNSYGINKAMGGVGIALQSGRSLNHSNPASYLGVAPNAIVAEAGAYGLLNTSQTNKNIQTDGNMNFSYFSAGFYMNKNWALSFGVYPYSSVDYEVNSVGQVIGELTTFDKTYTGNGGLSRASLGNSVRLYKGLSAGFNASYIFGLVTQTETAHETDNFVGYDLTNDRFAGTFYLDYGLQYSITKNEWTYTAGLTYGARHTLNTMDDKTFTYNGLESELEPDDVSDIEIPEKIGLGIAVKNNLFRAGFDYEVNNWSSINYANQNVHIVNSNRYAFGAELLPSTDSKAAWYRNLSYMVGASYKNTNLEIDDTQISLMNLNAGVGIPFGQKSFLNFSVEYGQDGTMNDGLIKNNHLGFFVNLSLYEFLHKKMYPTGR